VNIDRGDVTTGGGNRITSIDRDTVNIDRTGIDRDTVTTRIGDLDRDGLKIAGAMGMFDPGPEWAPVADGRKAGGRSRDGD
jgi:hypothetical protein